MKNNNTKGTPSMAVTTLPNNELIARANLQSRDLTAQPYIKLNVGQGNSFIVKNSNIVITSNTINKAVGQAGAIPILNSSLVQHTQGLASGSGDYNQPQPAPPQTLSSYDKNDKVPFTSHYPNTTQSKLKQQPQHQRTYSLEQKSKIYQQQQNPQQQQQQALVKQTYGQQQPIANMIQQPSLGSRNQTRFQNTQSQGFGVNQGGPGAPKQNAPQTTSYNNQREKDRKFSYSPVLK